MRTVMTISGVLMLALGACSMQARPPSQSSTPAAPGSSSAMPQTSNSLPVGDTVNAPRAPATGTVSTTRP